VTDVLTLHVLCIACRSKSKDTGLRRPSPFLDNKCYLDYTIKRYLQNNQPSPTQWPV